jgi:hypothetical protein
MCSRRPRARAASFASGVFGGIHVFTDSGDVPDDWALRLVVLPPDAAFSKSGQSLAIDRATEILKKRGDQPRFKQNRLIFLAADYDSVSRLKDQVRSYLAWRSIVADYKDNRIVLDNLMAKQASKSLEQAEETVRRMIRETYKWIVAPMQEARPARAVRAAVGALPGQPGRAELVAGNRARAQGKRAADHRVGADPPGQGAEGLVLEGRRQGDQRLNVWQQSCQQLYLPRLKDDTVFQH